MTRPSVSELLNNGDSGFQELTIPDDASLDMNENNVINDESGTSIAGDSNLAGEHAIVAGEENSGKEEFDDDDSISELSCMSDLSNISGEDWKPISNHIKWVQMQMDKGTSPKDIVQQLTGEEVPDDFDDISALRFIVRILSESTVRSKLPNINTIEDVISLIHKSSKIIVLTGAGVSVSCGIPDFRSRNGIYARLSKDYPDLPDPQSMFDIHYFKRTPYPFFKFAKVKIFMTFFEFDLNCFAFAFRKSTPVNFLPRRLTSLFGASNENANSCAIIRRTLTRWRRRLVSKRSSLVMDLSQRLAAPTAASKLIRV